VRIGRLKRGLKAGEGVADALYGAGYGSPSRLYEKAPARLGMTPASYARGGRGARIAFTVVDHPLPAAPGRLLVAATDVGLCMIALGDDDDVLEAELRADYPAAEIRRDDGALAECLAAVFAVTDGRLPHEALSLDVRATAFQAQVWQRLQEIPRGETRTYGEIAAAMGRPTAARAVGRACALNPVSLVVPCHRAVGGDGALHGYRWGLQRKQALLDQEKEDPAPASQVRRR